MTEIQRMRAGCGVQGCLVAAVALFVVLLIAMLVIAFFRFQEPPVSPIGSPGWEAWAGQAVA